MEGFECPRSLRVGHAIAVVSDADNRPLSLKDRVEFDLRGTSRIGQAVVEQVIQDAALNRTQIILYILR